jgi:branched-chain amino acid aminotransferase
VLRLCRDHGIVAREKNFSLTEAYSAQEAFVTGPYAGVAPVVEIDGRKISTGRGPMVERLQQMYLALIERDVAAQRHS